MVKVVARCSGQSLAQGAHLFSKLHCQLHCFQIVKSSYAPSSTAQLCKIHLCITTN